MRKISIFTARTMLLFVIMQLTACQKLIDKIFPGHTNNDYTGCRIEHIKGSVEGSEEVIATVEYNEANNPVSIVYNKEIAYLLYSRYMFYDSNNRLMEYKVNYDAMLSVQDHRYGYSGDRIISDTATYRMTGYTVVLSTFEYDSKDRIVVQHQKLIDGEGDPDSWGTIIYNYDSNDNRVFDDEYTYDNKVNFRRTNKIWMFITRDYSQNNLQGATDYNEHGLPIRFDSSKDLLFETALSSIDYHCE
jgi:hypothetical protein